jgi:hypothetical protein
MLSVTVPSISGAIYQSSALNAGQWNIMTANRRWSRSPEGRPKGRSQRFIYIRTGVGGGRTLAVPVLLWFLSWVIWICTYRLGNRPELKPGRNARRLPPRALAMWVSWCRRASEPPSVSLASCGAHRPAVIKTLHTHTHTHTPAGLQWRLKILTA